VYIGEAIKEYDCHKSKTSLDSFVNVHRAVLYFSSVICHVNDVLKMGCCYRCSEGTWFFLSGTYL